MTVEALSIVRRRINLTSEKLALLFLRVFNEDEAIGQVEEAKLGGLRPDTLKQRKNRGDFPREINGVQLPGGA